MRKFTEEHKRKLSEAHRDQVSWRKGKIFVNKDEQYKNKLAYRRMWRVKNRERILKQEGEYRDKNRIAVNQYSRLRYYKNKQKELDRIRFKKYGITGEEYREILERQGIKCPICNRDITKNLSVDHNHITGKIRGLICNSCNLAIGNANDSPDRLRAMADYLERNDNGA
jgi:hypothetical protein